jgi:hypothetical protein
VLFLEMAEANDPVAHVRALLEALARCDKAMDAWRQKFVHDSDSWPLDANTRRIRALDELRAVHKYVVAVAEDSPEVRNAFSLWSAKHPQYFRSK